MANPNGRKGSKFETDIVNYLRSLGLNAERLPRTGAKDQGDGFEVFGDGRLYTMWEAKARARMDLPRYLRELAVEKAEFTRARGLDPWRVSGVVIVKRRMAHIGQSYVVQTVDDYFTQERQ